MNLLWSIAAWFGVGGAGHVVSHLPDNIIIASQSVTNVRRRIGIANTDRSISVTRVVRSVTFDG